MSPGRNAGVATAAQFRASGFLHHHRANLRASRPLSAGGQHLSLHFPDARFPGPTSGHRRLGGPSPPLFDRTPSRISPPGGLGLPPSPAPDTLAGRKLAPFDPRPLHWNDLCPDRDPPHPPLLSSHAESHPAHPHPLRHSDHRPDR